MLKRLPLGRKILFAFSVIFLIVLIVISAVITRIVAGNLNQRNEDYLRTYLSLIAQQMEARLDKMNHISVQVYYSKNILAEFSESVEASSRDNYFISHPNNTRRIDTALYPILGSDIGDIIVNLYNENGFYSNKYYPISWNRVLNSQESGHLYDISMRIAQGETPCITRIDKAYWTYDSYAAHSYISLSRYFQKYTVQKNIGYVEVLLQIKRFEQMLVTDAVELMTLLLDANGNVLCASEAPDDYYDSDVSAFLSGSEPMKDSFVVGNRSYICAEETIRQYGLSVVTIQRQNKSLLTHYIGIILSGGLLLYLLVLVMSVFVSRRLAQPIDRIVTSLREVSWDKLEMNLNLDSSYGDFDVLEESYSAMMQKLHDSVDLLIDSRLSEQKAVYLALQSQISPHFIYNTIANISACAYEYGAFKIVDICDKLCGLLRYATNYDDNLSNIERELEYTRNYLDLMKIRYEDRFFFSITASDDCSNVHIPRLITQTVIENCFKHAFDQKPAPWFIAVSAYIEKGWWLISIKHNGNPIPEKQFQDILQKSEDMYQNILNGIEKLTIGGLGLLNSVTRLRVLYNDEIRFEVFPDKDNNHVTLFGGKLK